MLKITFKYISYGSMKFQFSIRKPIMNLSSGLFLTLVVLSECISNSSDSHSKQCLNVKTDLKYARKRRHLTFPDKTNMVLTISLVKAFMTHAPSGWNIALEIDVMYPLPDSKTTNRFFRKKLHHKQKREFWQKIETALDFYNINGHACIYRAICETRSYVAPPGRSLIHDILRVIFTSVERDEEFLEEMKGHYDFTEPNPCNRANDCPISLFDLLIALNKQ